MRHVKFDFAAWCGRGSAPPW